MEIRYPLLILVVLVGTILFLILTKRKNRGKYTKGSKIANTKYIKKSNYYLKKVQRYKIAKILIYSVFATSLITSTILLVRLARVESTYSKEYSRDIYLCMDVSASINDLNSELVDNLKNVVNKLHGERFGISIFNTSSVVLSPLTDDYNYILEILDEIKKSIKATDSSTFGIFDEDGYFYLRGYLMSGTLEGNETRGSSLIGDGLASCVYSFSSLDEERTRIIILSTDNDLQGTPLLSLEKAAQISKNKGIKVYTIGAKITKADNRSSLEDAATITGGKFYDNSKVNVNEIVSDIESTSKSLTGGKMETKSIDVPEIPFIILVISIAGYIIVRKVVLK